MLWQASHTSSGGRWEQMLAQSQSSSAKRGGLAADVSSGLIFLKKKSVSSSGNSHHGSDECSTLQISTRLHTQRLHDVHRPCRGIRAGVSGALAGEGAEVKSEMACPGTRSPDPGVAEPGRDCTSLDNKTEQTTATSTGA